MNFPGPWNAPDYPFPGMVYNPETGAMLPPPPPEMMQPMMMTAGAQQGPPQPGPSPVMYPGGPPGCTTGYYYLTQQRITLKCPNCALVIGPLTLPAGPTQQLTPMQPFLQDPRRMMEGGPMQMSMPMNVPMNMPMSMNPFGMMMPPLSSSNPPTPQLFHEEFRPQHQAQGQQNNPRKQKRRWYRRRHNANAAAGGSRGAANGTGGQGQPQENLTEREDVPDTETGESTIETSADSFEYSTSTLSDATETGIETVESTNGSGSGSEEVIASYRVVRNSAGSAVYQKY